MSGIFKSIAAALALYIRPLCLLSVLVVLSACGGGSGGDGGQTGGGEDMDGSGPTVGTYTQISAAQTGQPLDFRVVSISNDQSDVLNIMGSLDSGRTVISVAGGSIMLTNPAGTEFMRLFDGTVAGINQFGTVGQETIVADIPVGGDATYNGVVFMTVANEEGNYSLTGDARIAVDWLNNGVDTRFDGLSGQRNDESIGSVSGTLSMINATLTGNGFSGGMLSRSGTIFATDDDPRTLDLAGQFFGPNADEVGGVFVLNANDLNVRAVFAAE